MNRGIDDKIALRRALDAWLDSQGIRRIEVIDMFCDLVAFHIGSEAADEVDLVKMMGLVQTMLLSSTMAAFIARQKTKGETR